MLTAKKSPGFQWRTCSVSEGQEFGTRTTVHETVRLIFCCFNQNVFCNITCLVNRSCCKHAWASICLWDTRLIDSCIYHVTTPGLQNECFWTTSHTEKETKKWIFHMVECSQWIVSDCGWGGCCLLVSPGLCGDVSLHQYYWCSASAPLM